jgi:DNA-binding FadR family transcriptional regulator
VPSKSTDADKPSETTKPDKDTATPVKSVAAAYETPKNLTARDILGARAQGANYKIRQVVERNNYSRIYHVETSFGNFDVVGDGLLKVRLAELDVLNILNERTQAGSFIEAFGTAAISPFKFGGQLLISPLDTVKNSFQGVGNFFDSLETSGENDDPNRGSFVASFSDADVDELFRLRSALEAYGAALAASRITADELRELEQIEQQLEQLARRAPTDLDGFARLNNAFHKLVLSAARSPRLEAMLTPLIDIPVVLLKHYTWQGKVDPARSNQHHREIIQALRARDPIWARSRMQAHIISTRPHPQAEDDLDEKSLNLGVEFD